MIKTAASEVVMHKLHNKLNNGIKNNPSNNMKLKWNPVFTLESYHAVSV